MYDHCLYVCVGIIRKSSAPWLQMSTLRSTQNSKRSLMMKSVTTTGDTDLCFLYLRPGKQTFSSLSHFFFLLLWFCNNKYTQLLRSSLETQWDDDDKPIWQCLSGFQWCLKQTKEFARWSYLDFIFTIY